MTMIDLSPRDRLILELEADWPGHGAAKEDRIERNLGITAVRYYQLLGRLLDAPAALAHDPLLVRRLRRMRETAAVA
ncbi:DUF3263 domain-containing protein [Microbacterium gorillae]|uniref:DUF3263 domain-containing protein n=1 Tax=Microbacterium gorillae TaxID=1231063 RepID=UPI000AFB6550|nr:DUF3263 domain-containing protein [Microbacterium gorillae]